MSPKIRSIITGMANGTFCVRTHSDRNKQLSFGKEASELIPTKSLKMASHNYQYIIRGKNEKASNSEFVTVRQHNAKLHTYERWMKRYRYKEALDAALANRAPKLIKHVIMELARYDGLERALRNRTPDSLLPLLDFINSYISDSYFTTLLIQVLHMILDIFAPILYQNASTNYKMQMIRKHISLKVNFLEESMEMLGIIKPILNIYVDKDL